jgi:hypothetical protein
MFLPSAIDVKHFHFVSFVNKYMTISFLFAMFTFNIDLLLDLLLGRYFVPFQIFELRLLSSRYFITSLCFIQSRVLCPVSLCFVDLFFLNELWYNVDPVKRLRCKYCILLILTLVCM